MFRHNSGFVGALLFGAVAALGFGAAVRAGTEWADPTAAAGLYLTGVSAAFTLLLDTRRSPRIGAVLLVAAVGVASALIAHTLAPTAIALTVAIGTARARLLAPRRLARAGLVELGIGTVALVAADFVARPSWSAMALAVWAYWLVQSAYFLLIGSETGSVRAPRDPFDVAAERANDLMDQSP